MRIPQLWRWLCWRNPTWSPLKTGWLNSLMKCGSIGCLGGGDKDFSFSPRSLGKWSNLTNIFQVGWFNHQLVVFGGSFFSWLQNSMFPPVFQIDSFRPKKPPDFWMELFRIETLPFLNGWLAIGFQVFIYSDGPEFNSFWNYSDVPGPHPGWCGSGGSLWQMAKYIWEPS